MQIGGCGEDEAKPCFNDLKNQLPQSGAFSGALLVGFLNIATKSPPPPLRCNPHKSHGSFTSNISTTSVYTHVAVDDDGEVGDLFEFENKVDG